MAITQSIINSPYQSHFGLHFERRIRHASYLPQTLTFALFNLSAALLANLMTIADKHFF